MSESRQADRPRRPEAPVVLDEYNGLRPGTGVGTEPRQHSQTAATRRRAWTRHSSLMSWFAPSPATTAMGGRRGSSHQRGTVAGQR